jgi:hypothetical protein
MITRVPKLLHTANCEVCNPHPFCEPVCYDDIEKRDHDAQEHANRTGHRMYVGFVFV